MPLKPYCSMMRSVTCVRRAVLRRLKPMRKSLIDVRREGVGLAQARRRAPWWDCWRWLVWPTAGAGSGPGVMP